MTVLLKITDITIDEALTPRDGVSDEIVDKYRHAILARCEFPPIVVAKENGKLILVDGRHRIEAHKKADKTEISATVTTLKRDRWFYYGVKINSAHGFALTETERSNAATRLKAQGFSDAEIEKAIAIAVEIAARRPKKVAVPVPTQPKSAVPRFEPTQAAKKPQRAGDRDHIFNVLQRAIDALKRDEPADDQRDLVEALWNRGWEWLEKHFPKEFG